MIRLGRRPCRPCEANSPAVEIKLDEIRPPYPGQLIPGCLVRKAR